MLWRVIYHKDHTLVSNIRVIYVDAVNLEEATKQAGESAKDEVICRVEAWKKEP